MRRKLARLCKFTGSRPKRVCVIGIIQWQRDGLIKAGPSGTYKLCLLDVYFSGRDSRACDHLWVVVETQGYWLDPGKRVEVEGIPCRYTRSDGRDDYTLIQAVVTATETGKMRGGTVGAKIAPREE